ncbi:MAG: bile acid:sodium symporter family protein [Myxococcales bacterium]|nr:bile acid:sodium symporter family protein [Myxococcales bacterium]
MFAFIRDLQPYIIPIQLLLAMLGMGATLSFRDFAKVFTQPKGVVSGLGLQWLFVPLLGQAFIYANGMSSGWAVGMVLVTVVPGGAMSNLFTFLGRGNTALSISVTIVTTLGSLLTIPLLLRLLAAPYMPPDFSFPALRIIRDVTFFLIIPVAVGMLIFRYANRHAEWVSKWSVRGTIFLILVITVGALGSGQIKIAAHGWAPPLQIVGFGLLMTILSAELSRLLGLNDADALALSIEVAVRNGSIGLLLVQYFFANNPALQGQVMYVVLFYSGLSLWLALPQLFRHRSGRAVLPWHKRRPGSPASDNDGAAPAADGEKSPAKREALEPSLVAEANGQR